MIVGRYLIKRIMIGYFLQFLPRHYDYGHIIVSKLLGNHVADFFCNAQLIGLGMIKEHIAALDIRLHVFEMGIGEGFPEFGHGQFPVTGHIDAAKDGDVGMHGTKLPKWPGSAEEQECIARKVHGHDQHTLPADFSDPMLFAVQ